MEAPIIMAKMMKIRSLPRPPEALPPGVQFTCFTGTKVKILTWVLNEHPSAYGDVARSAASAHTPRHSVEAEVE
jgi:hypothetical protein